MADHFVSQELELDGATALRLSFESYQAYGRIGCRHHIARTIFLAQLAVSMNARDHARLSILAFMLGSLYERTESLATIDMAVSVAQQAVDATPADCPGRTWYLSILAATLGSRYESSGVDVDIENAIKISRQVLENTATNDLNRPNYLSNMSNNLYRRYERTKSLEHIRDLEGAITFDRQALEATLYDDPGRPERLCNLGVGLSLRYERTEAPADIEEAVCLLKEAIETSPDGDPRCTEFLGRLGVILSRRVKIEGNSTDLDEAIRLTRQAIEAAPPDHIHLAQFLSNLAGMLRHRIEIDGSAAADLDQGVRLARQAVAATPNNHPEREARLTELANILAHRYKEDGERGADINEAIDLARQVIKATPRQHPSLRLRRIYLGDHLGNRYSRSGALSDLEEAINITRQAVRSIPASDRSHVQVIGLRSLATTLKYRYKHRGDPEDLEEAISVARQVIEAVPSNHTNRAYFFSELGDVLELRYELTEVLADLDEAVCLARRAVDATPESSLDQALLLNSLGARLRRRYKRARILGDLTEALSTARQAVNALPGSHPSRASCLSNLAETSNLLHIETKPQAGFKDSIDIAKQAVDATPESHPQRAGFIANLAVTLCLHHLTKGTRENLEEAIRLTRQATEAMPSDHRDLATPFLNLGRMLEHQYHITHVRHDLDEAVDFFRKAWNVAGALPLQRIEAVIAYLKLFSLDTCLDEAISMGKGALTLLPTVNTKRLSRNDQQHVIATFTGLAATLCSLLLASNQVEDALSSLEEGRAIILSDLLDARNDVADIARTSPGRAIILSDLLDARNDVADIARTSPGLACQLEDLRRKINAPLHDDDRPAAAREHQMRRRLDAVQDLKTCIQEIRTTPGNERFMMGLTTSDMRQCAEGGSIVVVNISSIRSDAIIITPQAVKAVQLTSLSTSDAQKWLREEWNMRPSRFAESNRKYREYLAWLWTSCVEQILGEISTLKGVPKDTHPLRVWWVGSGLASSMPFHAAGIHHKDKESTETAYHLTISSYVPSIKTLSHARNRVNAPQPVDSMLMVTMPTTPAAEDEGAARMYDLPGVTAEKNMLVDAAEGHVTAEHMGGPSVESVLEALPRCSIAHFACHGVSDPVDPSQSGLLLQRQDPVSPNDTDSKLIQDKLSVGRVSELNLRNARLAYLSACSTAQNKSSDLSDEVIHVVSGFQVAGFPHVVGCLWPSKDDTCVLVAERFYSQLLGRASPWRDDTVARAIRHAVTEVMKDPRERGLPLKWATFVHYGP